MSLARRHLHPVVATVREFVQGEVRATAPALDHADAYPHALVARMKDLGLFGALVPTQWGGLGLDVGTYAQVAFAIPLLFLVTPETPEYAYVFGIVFGFAMGADYMLIPLMAADLFGLRSLAVAMSVIVPSDTVTQYWATPATSAWTTSWLA